MTYDPKAEADRLLDTVVQSVEVDFYDERYEVDARACRKSIEQALTAAYEAGERAAYQHVEQASSLPGDPLRTLVIDHGVVDGARRIEIRKAPPPGHVLTDDGVVRRVLGTLPVTADGCVYGCNAIVYWCDEPHDASVENVNASSAFFEDHAVGSDHEPWGKWEAVSVCYSTREAAEAARQRGEA